MVMKRLRWFWCFPGIVALLVSPMACKSRGGEAPDEEPTVLRAVSERSYGLGGESPFTGVILGGAGERIIVRGAKARILKGERQTASTYDYTPDQGLVLFFEEAVVLPAITQAGKHVEASIQYAILGAGEGVSVTETRALYYGDGQVLELSSKAMMRTNGTWYSTQSLQLPRTMPRGEYTMIQRVRAGAKMVTGVTDFTIEVLPSTGVQLKGPKEL